MLSVRWGFSALCLVSVQASGCGFDSSSDWRSLDEPASEEPDNVPTSTCPAWGLDPVYFAPCEISPGPALSLTLAGVYLYDTATSTLRGPSGVELGTLPSGHANGMHLLVVDNLFIASGAVLRAKGPQPLLLGSWGDIRVDGVIDVSSVTEPGAGADAGCPTSGNGGQHDRGGSGGAGGSLMVLGGSGAAGANGAGERPPGGVPQTPAFVPSKQLRGGCPGGRGGSGLEPTDFGAGGAGGGAVALSARNSIQISGEIRAGGGGGAVGPVFGGGGGGGSGGMIGLQAKTFAVTGRLHIDGGGGGGGSAHTTPADPGEPAAPAGRSRGGAANHSHAGDGGDGSVCNDAAQGGDTASGLGIDRDSGGGGGGGAGYVQVLDEAHRDVVEEVLPNMCGGSST